MAVPEPVAARVAPGLGRCSDADGLLELATDTARMLIEPT